MIPLSWKDARLIAKGALNRSFSDQQERRAVANLIDAVTTRPTECRVWNGTCMTCPVTGCPFGRKDET